MDRWTALLQVVASGLLTGGLYALVGIGLSLIFGVMRVVNFAHGEFLALGMYGALLLFNRWHVDPFASVLAILPAGFVLGYGVERGLLSPLARAPEQSLILMTVGLGLILSNLLLFAFGAHPQSIYTAYSTATFHVGGVSLSRALSASFGVTVLVIALLYYLLLRTELGRAIRATAQNPQAAELQGIDTARIRAVVFGLGVALAAVAGTLMLPILYVIPTIGGVFTLKAFVVTVLGGMGNVAGAIGGGLLLGLAESLGATYVSSGYRDAFGLLAFLLVLLARPAGLFGKSRV
ncbi:branched-chain amino acid ABC transporter permease [Carboxydochorda subterranea]|uniref:Branched-chain amino acid ABC transporter permease n=1 Tax=Carboxydichorda subterranea TaxID=3109565 RepID=A0ABZ1BVQ1_9FIRM|nr:branched-chain amino acid ABC transporter permease [Limnochorda sp. L945t]WRP16733.1 branched-chain amino acid ABC transporter permease [Limnochorda sp. L945t]